MVDSHLVGTQRVAEMGLTRTCMVTFVIPASVTGVYVDKINK